MSTPDLFDTSAFESPSPKLRWMREHGILTHHFQNDDESFWLAGFQAWHPGLTGADFFDRETGQNGSNRIGEGDTEHDALAELMSCSYARERGLRLWFECDITTEKP